jgi:CHAT domain-containing protein/Tfp pilus assembly protein PilF
MTRRLVCVGATFAAVCLAAIRHPGPRLSAQAPDLTVLEAGKAIERQLTRGEEHGYAVALSAGQSANVIVEQHGIDAIIQVRSADGTVLADVQEDLSTHGREHVDVVASTSGTYMLVVRTPPGIVGAGAYSIRLAGIRPATDADRSLQESRTMRSAAARLERAGRFNEARPLFERALEIAESVSGPDDPFVNAVVRDLAGNALEARDNRKAQSLYERALTGLEATVGAGDPQTAMVQSRLGLLYQRAGQRPKADAMVRQALATIEKTLGTEHPWYVRCLVTLGTLRDDAGDLDEAEAIDRKALAIVETIHETDSIVHADLLNNLGDIHRQRGDYAQAQALFERSLAIGEKLRGPESYYVATVLQNLGIVARERKEYSTAQAYYRRAIAIREATVGPDHTDVAQLLNNLANTYNATGDKRRALETHFRALRIWEKNAGPYERGTLLSTGNIARTYASDGDIPNAIDYQRRADAVLEAQLALNLAAGSERQKLAFAASASERTDRTISLHLNLALGDPDAAALGALVLLQRKGRVLDAMTDTFAAVRHHLTNPGDLKLLDELKATTAQLARFALSAPESMRPEERQNAIQDLEAKKERLEVELSERCAEFRAQTRPVTLEAVQAALPDDAALLEFAVFRPFDPTAERNAEAYGLPHYAAYIVRKHGTPRGFDLGEAKTIDERIEALRLALRDPRIADVKERARALDRLVMRPLRASLGLARRLFISPDGELHLVPFEALVDEQGRYLIERYPMSYLTSGRDLLRMQVVRENRSRPVILADPLFGEPGITGLAQPSRKKASAVTARRSVTTGNDLSRVYFAPLAGSAEEARAIKALFPEASLLTGSQATKAALQSVERPRMLHIASHGFFLQDAGGPAPSPVAPTGATRSVGLRAGVQNPLLRSGVALAGANLGRGSEDDGILTALEASSLNLWGTKLVTLSACDTGVGEIRNGEGVYGLRRAFVLAGAETLVMSLWPVNDSIARETMVAYYIGLRDGAGRGDALRQAKLEMLRRTARQHPFYWAGFIQSGEWANLDGVR